jgi:hypothetical protein
VSGFQTGDISGTALAGILARRLQVCDPDGQMRHTLGKFPMPGLAEKILTEYFIPGVIDRPARGAAVS